MITARRFFYTLVALALLALLALVLFINTPPKDIYAEGAYCAFCDPEVLERQHFYEDDLVFAMLTHKPIYPGHCLVIPKRHVPRFEGLTEEEVVAIHHALKVTHQAITKLHGTVSYFVLQKNGVEAGPSVPHVHVHYIPRKAGDYSLLSFFTRFFIAGYGPAKSAEWMNEESERVAAAVN